MVGSSTMCTRIYLVAERAFFMWLDPKIQTIFCTVEGIKGFCNGFYTIQQPLAKTYLSTEKRKAPYLLQSVVDIGCDSVHGLLTPKEPDNMITEIW